jgi:hypothetical protein
MNRKLLIPLFAAIMISTSSCFLTKSKVSQSTTVTHLTDTLALRDGSLVYALPRTIFTIRVEFERTIEIPGPYARYAGELLGLDNVIQSEGESWLIKRVSVSSHEEADPSEFYVIESNTLMKSNVLALRKEGLILDLNPESQIGPNGIESGKDADIDLFRSYDLGSDEYYRVQTDTVFRRVSVEEQFIRIPYIVEQKKKLSDAQLAERAARRLMELRDGKFLILTGEANVFPQSEAAINEINRMEKELTELFAGKTFRDTRTFTYNISPDKAMIDTPITVFRFSEVTGPEEETAENGIPVMLELIPEKKTKDLSVITRTRTEPGVPVTDKLYYRIPDIVNVAVKMGDEQLYSSRKMIYQFGEVMQLPANYIIGK